MAPDAKQSTYPSCGSWSVLNFVRDLYRIKVRFVENTERVFERWGDVCFRYPYFVIIGCMVLFSIGVMGFITSPEWVDNAEELYSLPQSQARADGALLDSLFGEWAQRPTYIGIEAGNGEDILTWELLEYLEIFDKVIRGKIPDPFSAKLMRIDPDTLDQDSDFVKSYHASGLQPSCYTDGIGFECLCSRNIPGKGCDVQSLIDMGILDIANNRDRGRSGGRPELYVIDGLIYSAKGLGFIPQLTIGEMKIEVCVREFPRALVSQVLPHVSPEGSATVRQEVGCVTSIGSLRLIYLLRLDVSSNEAAMVWEDIIVNHILENADAYLNHYGYRVYVNAMRSRDDELKASTSESSDILFVFLTFVILVFYSVGFNFDIDLYKSKTWTAMAGVTSAILGMVAGIGFVCYMGIALVPTALIVPFLAMGIGVDDMFVLINSFSLTYVIPSPRKRVMSTMADSGLSISITTLTNLIAFGIGSFSPYLSIRNFCLFSAGGLGFGYLFAISFMVAILSLEAYREIDVSTCCFFPWRDLKNFHRDQEPELQGGENVQDDEPKEIVTFRVMKAFNENKYWSKRLPPHIKAALNQTTTGATKDPFHFFRPEAARHRFMVNYRRSAMDCDSPILESPSSESNWGTANESFRDVGQHGVAPISPATSMSCSEVEDEVWTALLDEPKGNVGRWLRDFMLNTYGMWLMRPWVKVLVICGFTALAAISSYGIVHVPQGLDLKDLSPHFSYLRDYDDFEARDFSAYDLPTSLFFEDGIEWHRKENQLSAIGLMNALNDLDSVSMINSPLDRILGDATYFNPYQVEFNDGYFSGAVKQAIAGEGAKYSQFFSDFRFNGDTLIGWRATIFPKTMFTSEERAAFMISIRNLLNGWATPVSANSSGFLGAQNEDREDEALNIYGERAIRAVAYNYLMIFYESDLGIKMAVITSMGVAAVAMLFVSLLLLSEISMGLIVVAMLFLIDLNLIGFMTYWEVPLNMISMINLVISVGFAVDYAAHICHTYSHCLGPTPEMRVVETLVLMGAAVLNGAVSTLIGILMLGFSSSYIFQVFFKLFILVVIFGASHGMILLPVILSFMGGNKPLDGLIPQYNKIMDPVSDIASPGALRRRFPVRATVPHFSATVS